MSQFTKCCGKPQLHWRTNEILPEAIVACRRCGFSLDPDGILIDWLTAPASPADETFEHYETDTGILHKIWHENKVPVAHMTAGKVIWVRDDLRQAGWTDEDFY